jgi:hypothetical protein
MLDINNLINWKKFTITVIIGYAVSWIYFLVSLALFRNIFGMVKGAAIAYLSSWLVWILTAYLLHSINQTGDKGYNNIYI